MVKYLRPKDAAQALGFSIVTLYRRAKEDPDFPRLINLSPGHTVISEQDLVAYVEKKAKASEVVAA